MKKIEWEPQLNSVKQKVKYNEVNEEDACYISKEICKEGAKIFTVSDYETFFDLYKKLPPNGKMYHEIIKKKKCHIKFFLDIEVN
jgi:hypothetical protein